MNIGVWLRVPSKKTLSIIPYLECELTAFSFQTSHHWLKHDIYNMLHLQWEISKTMRNIPNQLWQVGCHLSHCLFFFWRPRNLPGMNKFFLFLTEQNVQMSFLLPNNFFMSSEAMINYQLADYLLKSPSFPYLNLPYQFLIVMNQIRKMLFLIMWIIIHITWWRNSRR